MQDLCDERVKYLVYQKELGANSELPHFQAYVEFYNKITRNEKQFIIRACL